MLPISDREAVSRLSSTAQAYSASICLQMVQLLAAALRGDIEGLQYHMSAGSAVDEVAETEFTNSCSTALHAAAEDGNLGCVTFLIEQGASVTLADSWGHTAAHLAAQEGHAAVIEVCTWCLSSVRCALFSTAQCAVRLLETLRAPVSTHAISRTPYGVAVAVPRA